MFPRTCSSLDFSAKPARQPKQKADIQKNTGFCSGRLFRFFLRTKLLAKQCENTGDTQFLLGGIRFLGVLCFFILHCFFSFLLIYASHNEFVQFSDCADRLFINRFWSCIRRTQVIPFSFHPCDDADHFYYTIMQRNGQILSFPKNKAQCIKLQNHFSIKNRTLRRHILRMGFE